jgi:Holliday junction DNA helicase RuvA
MFESIQGHLVEKEESKAIVETYGIGYRLTIPLNTYNRLPHVGATVRLFLSQVVREDAHTLYAFFQKEERDLFELLITISGIGPKTAAAIVGHVEMGLFQNAIHTSDIRFLSKIPGIGKKTAERLIIEMRDKISSKIITSKGLISTDAINALLNLGYAPLDAQRAVHAVLAEKTGEMTISSIITAALQKI